MITKKLVKWHKNGTTRSAHLITNLNGSRQLAMVKNGQTLYAQLTQGTNANQLEVNDGSSSYYVTDITPTVVVSSYMWSNPQPYKDPYVVDYVEINLNVAINNPIEVQYGSDAVWFTLLTLPAGTTTSRIDNFGRIDSQTWRIKVGSWTTQFTQYMGSDSTTRSIPEAYWGV